jgi:dUTP pyrophosphatase
MIRGFEVISEFEEMPKGERPTLPERKTSGSAGYDFHAMEDINIPAGDFVWIRTGIKAYMPPDEFLALYMRSSMGIKHSLRLVNCTAVIDSDYYNNADNEGEIIAVIKNEGRQDFLLEKGERFMQGVFHKFSITDNDNAGGERTGGIGSTK